MLGFDSFGFEVVSLGTFEITSCGLESGMAKI